MAVTNLDSLTLVNDLIVGGILELSVGVWDDLRSPLTRDKQGQSQKPDFDFTNMGLLFPQNNSGEIVYIINQIPHMWKIGSAIYPHIHWIQTGASFPVWKIDYRIYQEGADPTGGFTTLSVNTGIFTYVSGSLHQISYFSAIDMASITDVSAIIEIRLYRDDNVVSGDVLGKEFDIHYQKNKLGTIDQN